MTNPVAGSEDVLAVLAEAADAVADALANTSNWGEVGQGSGQYFSDLEADAAACAVLTGAGLGVLSEESARRHEDRAVTVVLDPLDGSTNASRQMSWWATSLCAVDAEGMLASLVVDLRHGTRYHAVRGGGAFRDGEAIQPSGCEDIADAIIGINGVPAGHGGWAQYRAFGATALDLCAVADGTFDGYLDATTDSLGVWDYLGATLICQEAGARVTDARSRDLVTLAHDHRRIPVGGASLKLTKVLAALHPEFGLGKAAVRLP